MKTFNLILIGISLLVFSGYFLFCYKRWGILKSISQSYFQLAQNEKWLFTFFMWTIALPLMIVGHTFLSVMAGVFLCYTGAAGDTKDDKASENVHVIGATGAIILGYSFLMHLSVNLKSVPLFVITLVCILASLFMYWEKTKNHTTWIEGIAYYAFVTGLLIKII